MKMNVGIDIGSANVKLVCLEKKEKEQTLMAHGFFKRTHLAKLMEVLAQKEIRTASLRVNIEDPTIKIRRLDIPSVPKEEVAAVIQWSLKDLLPGRVEDFIFRYQALPKEEEKKELPYLVYAIPRAVLKEYLDFLKTVGIRNPEMIEPQPSAFFLALRHNYNFSPEERPVVLNIGAKTAFFTVMGPDGPLFSRPLGGVPGQILTKQISRNLGVSEEEAEQLKVESRNNPKVTTTLSHYFLGAAVEIQRSIDAYMIQCIKNPVTKIFLTGGGANLAGFAGHIGETLKIATEIFDPLQKIRLGQFAKENLETKKVYYALACGLALE